MTRFNPQKYYRTKDPALALIATSGTLAVWRHAGRGPSYLRFGNRVLYYGSDLNSWLDEHIVVPADSQKSERKRQMRNYDD